MIDEYSTMPVPSQALGRVRLRLAPEIRIEQILDGALIEFSERGFTATRMDDIAQRCSLSKGGLYAHFKSKDEVFAALLQRSFTPPDWSGMPAYDAQYGVRPIATWLVHQLHHTLMSPTSVNTLRLLVSESARMPHLVAQWEQNVLQPHLALLGKALEPFGGSERATTSVVVREPWLALAPVVHALLAQVVFGQRRHKNLADYQQGHIDLLCELLER